MRVVRPWPTLLREAVAAPSLAVFKARLDGAWSSLVWWKMSLPMAGGLDLGVCKVSSNPNYSMILWYSPEKHLRNGKLAWRSGGSVLHGEYSSKPVCVPTHRASRLSREERVELKAHGVSGTLPWLPQSPLSTP